MCYKKSYKSKQKGNLESIQLKRQKLLLIELVSETWVYEVGIASNRK